MEDTITFKIHGDYLTDLCRSLWADEDAGDKAVHILTEAFPEMPQSVIMAILTGSKKLVGCNEAMELVDDDAEASPAGNPLSNIRQLDRFRELADEYEDVVEFATGSVKTYGSPGGPVKVTRRKSKMLQDGKAAWEGVTKIPADTHQRAMKAREEQSNGVHTAWNGWLSPKGRFYPCTYMGHIDAADELGYEEVEVEKLGWVKLSSGEWFQPDKELTQRQLDWMFDWCVANSKELPYWARGDEE